MVRISLFLIVMVFTSVAAQASIVITGTRVIYPSDAKEVSVKVSNKGKSPVLIQSWIDDGDTKAKPDQIKVPFLLTPPINRVEPQNGQTLRIRSLPNTLPTDRESLFWLNVLEIPAQPREASSAKSNYLQVAFRNRIKFFWRPVSLKGSLAQAVKALQWRRDKNGLHVSNSSPFYISFVEIRSGNKTADGKILAPFAEDHYALSAHETVQVQYVSDFGAVVTENSVVH